MVVNRWDEKAGFRWDAVRSQVIDALEAQEMKETVLKMESPEGNSRSAQTVTTGNFILRNQERQLTPNAIDCRSSMAEGG
jgi:hypothetical protein